ncbi:MAG TPA: MinD/ParA family protein [Polyangiales bacterium]|nr:MinD/ParA family protein [Polyangiales bacterium]
MSQKQAALVVAVGGGKGGVGKSVVAANLAVALAKHGARVIAVDADLGSANLHTLFGIDHPQTSLQALIEGRSERLDDLTIPTSVTGLRLVAGSVALPGAANLQHARKQKLLRHIAKLTADVVVVDCGAGVHYNVVDFFAAADLQLLVSSAQLISLQNAYGFLKASLYRTLRQRATDARRAELLEPSGERSEVETMNQLLARVATSDPELAALLQGVLRGSRVSLLGNQLADARELNALHSLSRMIGDFLSVRVPVLGGLCRRDKIHASVTRRRPFLADAGLDPESQLLLALAASLLERRSFAPLASEPLQPTAAASSKYQRQRAYARSSPNWPAVTPESGSGVRPSVRRDRLGA